MRNSVQVDACCGIDLATKIVKGHQQIRCELVGLVLDPPIFGVPTDDVLLPASDAFWELHAVQEVVPQFVGEREVDPSWGGNGAVVDDAPASLPSRRAIEGTIESGQVVALHQGDGIARESLGGVVTGDRWDVDREMVRTVCRV